MIDPIDFSAFSLNLLGLLVDASVKGTLLLTLAGIGSLLLRRRTAAFRHMLWALILTGLIFLPLLSFVLPGWQSAVVPEFSVVADMAQIDTVSPPVPPFHLPMTAQFQPGGSATVSTEPGPAVSFTPPPPVQNQPEQPVGFPVAAEQPEIVSSPLHWSAWVILAWLAGVALFLIPLLVGTACIWRLVRRADLLTDERADTMARLATNLGVKSQVKLLVNNQTSVPITWGLLHPIVLLPSEVDGWTQERLRVVLLHELAHIQRGDYITHFLSQIARAMYWFNPLVWLAARQLRIERERACDDYVLSKGEPPSEYATHLLEIARTSRRRQCADVAAVAMARRSQIEGRLLAILDHTKNRRGLTRISIAMALVALLCFLVPLATLQPTAAETETTLKIARQVHVTGGDVTLEGQHSGESHMPLAWSEEGFALIYWDYAPKQGEAGCFLLLIDSDGKPVVPPIHLFKDWSDSEVFWDGKAYVCLFVQNAALQMKRFLPDGNLDSEKTLPISVGKDVSFVTMRQDDVIHLVRRVGDSGAEWIDFSIDGERLSEPVKMELRGEFERAVFLEQELAVLSKVRSFQAGMRVYGFLQVFDAEGQQIGMPTEIANLSMAPSRSLHRNGNNLVCLAGREDTGDGISIISFLFDEDGKMVREPVVIGSIPPEGYYGAINFSTELVWTGSQYLAVWDQGIERSGRQEDIWARLLDSTGQPTGEPLKINDKPLDQVNHATVLTDKGFVVFSVEQGSKNPSVTFTQITADVLQPTFTPTPTLDPRIPTSTPTPTVVPRNQAIVTITGELHPFDPAVLIMKGRSISTLKEPPFGDKWNATGEFTDPLPAYSVNVTGTVIKGTGVIAKIEQPRPTNDYTARMFYTRDVTARGGTTTILVSWGEEVQPEPTPTPFPKWEPGAATPTPLQGAPKVLWIVKEGTFPKENHPSRDDSIDFRNLFAEFGASGDALIAGKQLVTDELLKGYTAVVFGDTRNVPPLTGPEKETVVRFVRGGGSIFVIGQQDSRVLLDPAAIYASSITEPFGIRFSTSIGGTYTNFLSHPLTYNLAAVSGTGGAILVVDPPAKAIGFAEKGEAILAYAEDGYGRVAAFTDETTFFSTGGGFPGWGLSELSNRQLARNITAWLLRKEELLSAPPTPPPTPYLIWEGNLKAQGMLEMKIRGEAVTLQSRYAVDSVSTSSARFSEPLPAYAVDITVAVTSGGATIKTIDQPRSWNDFTATVILQPSRSPVPLDCRIVVRWGKEVSVDPTPTPWPTAQAGIPTPKPYTESPKVLWLVRKSAISLLGPGNEYDSDRFDKFAAMFTELGATNEAGIIGSASVTTELLTGYQAVIFGDTQQVPPVAESETKALAGYVERGGSILVMGRQWDEYILNDATLYANSVTIPFGIQFSTRISDELVDIRKHYVTSGVTRASEGGGKLLVTERARPLILGGNGAVAVAVSERGHGRVVAVGNVEILYDGVERRPSANITLAHHPALAKNIAVWLLRKEAQYPVVEATPTPTFVPGGSDEDAQVLVTRMLEGNQPWLKPCSISATYSLSRVYEGKTEDVGSYTVDQGGMHPLRVGSMIWTPLHSMAKGVPYTVRMLGRTTTQGVSVVAVDVLFGTEYGDKVGMGGQANTTFSSRTMGGFRACRILIEPEKAIPLFIGCSRSPILPNQAFYFTAWMFAPDFLEVDGKLAPHLIESIAESIFNERQEFQVVQGAWIFKTGSSWDGEFSQFGKTGRTQTINLVDLKITSVDGAPRK